MLDNLKKLHSDRGGGAVKYLHDVQIEATRDSSLIAVQILRALFLSEWKS